MSLFAFDFRFGEAGWFLLVFIVSSVSIIITTVNNNIYNYSYKYKKKHKLLNQISKWKTKKKKHFRPNTSIELLRDIFTWNNRTKKKRKNHVPLRPTKKKKKNHVPLRPTNPLLLLLLLTMTTHTIAANDLEGIIIRFAPHPNPAFPFLHHTLNGVYGIDLYEADCHLVFDDFATNGLTELYKDAPKRLLDHMLNHIKTESGASTRGNTAQVDELFATMLWSYRLKSGRLVAFKRGQDLATGILHYLAQQREDVPTKCMEVLLCCYLKSNVNRRV